MSRKTVTLTDGRIVVFGYDRPFNSYFGALYDPHDPASIERRTAGEEEVPFKAFGYHPAEQGATPPGTDYGPYPADLGVFDSELRKWGVDGKTRERFGKMLAQMDNELT